MYILIALPILFIFLTLLNYLRRPSNFPPGPLSLPIVGGTYRLGKDPFANSIKLWNDYGPIVGIDFGPHRSVIINDHKLLKSALSNPSLQGRPDIPFWKTKYRVKNGLASGIIASEGSVFQQNHRFSMRTLKEFGFGTKRMEIAILEQVDMITKHFDEISNQGANLESTNLFQHHTANIIWALLSARKIPSESQRLKAIETASEIKEIISFAAIILLFPWIIKTMPRLSGWTKFLGHCKDYADIFDDCIREHRKDRCEVDNEKDFIDLYLDQVDRTTDPSSIFYGDFADFNLNAIISDMVSGGVDTTGETMTWSMAILINFPHIQRKLQHEVDQVVEPDEQVTLAHRSKLVYVEAFIKEVMRFRPIVPWSLPHKATEDTKIENWNIPKGTTIYPNFFGTCEDPSLWENPQEFQPERFLNGDCTELVAIETFFFSVGRRICPGRSLGMDELFLMLGNIVHRYDIQGIPGEEMPSLKHMPLMIMTPYPFKFQVQKRQKF